MTRYRRIVSILLIVCLTLSLLPDEAWATDNSDHAESTANTEDLELPAPVLTEEPASEDNPAISVLPLEENPTLSAAGDESSVSDDCYTTTNDANGISISTEQQSYTANYGDSIQIPFVITVNQPYEEGSHAFIGYLAVLNGYQWNQIASWWIDGGSVRYTLTLDSEDFDVNRELQMVASVFPADNFSTGASLCDHLFSLTVHSTGDQIVLDSSMVQLEQQELVYDGSAKEPDPIVTYNGTHLIRDTDYSVTYSNNINAGTGTVVVKGKGDYTGTVDRTFLIQKAEPVLSFEETFVTKTPDSDAFVNSLTSLTDGTITFQSNDPAVAAVDAQNGLVTAQAVGIDTITADASEGANYKAGSASYTLAVSENQAGSCTVFFDPNGGTLSDLSKTVIPGETYGTLPEPDPRSGFTFTGWYTEPTGGTLITASTTVTQTGSHILYAHWGSISAEGEFSITAGEDTPVTVTEKKEPVPVVPDPLYKTLLISTGSGITIQRDYEQNVTVSVYNRTGSPVWFYLTAENDGKYSDLSYETIQSGSKDSPMMIDAYETVDVTLSIFAQNAEQETYIIPLTAYVQTDGEYTEDSKSSVTVNCDLPILDLTWTLVSSSNTSLSHTYRIRNNSDALTDLTVSVSDTLKDYVSFDPIIANYQLGYGSSVEFTVYPDLVKMKNENLSKLTGQLIASCAGKTSEQDCTFDTQGKEITVTTMGKLVLQQDGNPFTEFEISDEYSLKYKNADGTFAEVTGSTEPADILDENNFLEYEYDASVCLGSEMDLNVETKVKSYEFTGNSEDYEDGTIITMTAGAEPGIIYVTMQSIMDYESYLQLIGLQNSEQAALTSYAKDVMVESVTSWSVDQATDIVLEQLTGVSWAGDVYDAGKYLIEAEASSIIVDYDPRISQQAKSNYKWATVMQGLLTFGGIAVSLTCPAVGFVFSIMTAPLSVMIEDYQDALIEEEYAKYAEIYASIFGSQCTNRGSIGVGFYVPGYGEGQKPVMHTSGRMYRNGYVNQEDTNYDISLNGKPVGETHNSGLTDLHMEEIPTDYLLPGRENSIVFDYDTSPGSHTVNTETEISLLYPYDTEIAYIDQPDDLRDVRTKPDFCVYGENIYTDDAIVGESTKVYFNVYNRGSCGGWFTVTCSDGDSILYQEVNYYLAAFSSKTFSVDWTPKTANTTFTVTLENTSVNLEERSTDNNTASHTLTARTRQIPSVVSSKVGTIYEDEPFSMTINVEQGQDIVGESFSVFGTGLSSYLNLQYECSGSGASRRYRAYSDSGLAAGSYSVNILFSYLTSASTRKTKLETINFTVTQKAWVVPSISAVSSTTLRYGDLFTFSVFNIDNLLRTEIAVDDGVSAETAPIDSQSSFGRDYSVDMSGYATGEHTISIRAYYLDRSGEELYQEKIVKITLKSESDSYYTFTLSSAIANGNPVFEVYRNNSYRVTPVTIEQTGSEYRFLKSDEMISDPSIYNLVVYYDSGVVVQNLATTGLVDTVNCRRAVLVLDAGNELTSAEITGYTSTTGEYLDINRTVSWDTPLVLSPGKYSLSLTGTVDGVWVYPRVEIDVTEQSQVIDLSEYALIYRISIDEAGSSSYQVSFRIRENGSSTWQACSLSQSLENDGKTLKCYTTSSSTMQQIQESDQVYLLAYSNREVYFVKIRDTSDEAQPMLTAIDSNTNDIVLEQSTLNRVTLVTQSGDYSVSSVNVQWDNLSVYLRNPSDNIIYLPDGEYTMYADFTDGVQTFSSTVSAEITEDCEVVLDENLNAEYTDVVLSWVDTYDASATVSCSNSAKNWYLTLENVSLGDSVKVLNGDCTFTITLTCNSHPVSFTKSLTVGGTDETPSIFIGNRLSAAVSSYFDSEYEAGDTIYFSLNTVQDENGNTLRTRYFDSVLNGIVTFTDITDTTRQFTSTFSTYSISTISAQLPDEAGQYTMEVYLAFAPEPVSVESVSGGSVTLLDPSNVLSEGAMVFAARYEDGKMTEITSATLSSGSVSVTFDHTLSSDWTLFFLDNYYKPLCGKVSLLYASFLDEQAS